MPTASRKQTDGLDRPLACCNKLQAKIEAEGQAVPESLFYMTQTIGNACGTIGLLHAVS